MRSAWRIVNARHAKQAFTGEGARLEGGRWNSIGLPLVYLAAQRSLAVLEVLVNARSISLEEKYVLIQASWDELLMQRLSERKLPEDWRALPPPAATAAIGDAWMHEARSLVLEVPNVIIRAESNYLINPAHRDFPRMKFGKPERFSFDPRLLQR